MKELNADVRRAINRGDQVPREYRLQAPGEEVELMGMRHHEALNGRSGEVISRVADDQAPRPFHASFEAPQGFLMVEDSVERRFRGAWMLLR